MPSRALRLAGRTAADQRTQHSAHRAPRAIAVAQAIEHRVAPRWRRVLRAISSGSRSSARRRSDRSRTCVVELEQVRLQHVEQPTSFSIV
jgi:hypothetical protein